MREYVQIFSESLWLGPLFLMAAIPLLPADASTASQLLTIGDIVIQQTAFRLREAEPTRGDTARRLASNYSLHSQQAAQHAAEQRKLAGSHETERLKW